jgi:hypothetical protein
MYVDISFIYIGIYRVKIPIFINSRLPYIPLFGKLRLLRKQSSFINPYQRIRKGFRQATKNVH